MEDRKQKERSQIVLSLDIEDIDCHFIVLLDDNLLMCS